MAESREAEFGRQFAEAMFGGKPVRKFADILPSWAKGGNDVNQEWVEMIESARDLIAEAV